MCVPAARINGTPVLVAYDGSLQAGRTLQAFVESGLGADREIYVASLGNQAQESADLARDFLSAHAMAPRLLIEESAAQSALQLLKIAQQIQAGLIVLGAYGQPRLKEFFLGSVTKGVLAATTVPLFLYH
jgi:nucleotide-binding universal stress UspA family protein